MENTRKIVNKRIEYLRKDILNLTQPEFAKKLGFDDVKKGRSTVNNWEQGAVQVKSDDLILISETFDVPTDWLLGREKEPSLAVAISTASDITGLSEKAIHFLHYLNSSGNEEEKKTISFINRVLGDPSKGAGTGLLELTLFSWMEQYVTADSVKAVDMLSNNEIASPGIKSTSGIPMGFDFGAIVKEFFMSKIKEGLNQYLNAQRKQEAK